MKLAVSNIAWSPEHRAAAYDMLQAHGVRGLEIAPGLFFDRSADPFAPTGEELAQAMREARRAGLELVSMQALLFGAAGAALFGSPREREAFRSAMLRAIGLAGRLSIPNLVFGSPRQRVVPEGMTEAEAQELALRSFAELGDAARRAGTKLGLEANPAAYGANFLTTLEEADAFMARLDHPAVTLTLDLGAMHMNGSFPRIADCVARLASPISHVHVSEPHLAPAPADAGQAATALTALSRRGYSGWVSIEMKQPPEPVVTTLEAALGRLQQAVGLASKEASLT